MSSISASASDNLTPPLQQVQRWGEFSVSMEDAMGFASQDVKRIVLKSSRVSAEIVSYGATLTSVVVDGQETVLGFSGVDACLHEHCGDYMGCMAGRFANRIKEGKFDIDGESYQLYINNGPNSLHGGKAGFNKLVWRCSQLVANAHGATVVLSLHSADGDEGYPGNLEVEVAYRLGPGPCDLSICKRAKTDKATPVNLTNHAYCKPHLIDSFL